MDKPRMAAEYADMLAAIDGLFASAMAAYMDLGTHLKQVWVSLPPGEARTAFDALYQRGRALGLSMTQLDKDMSAWVDAQDATPDDNDKGDTLPCGCFRDIRNATVCGSIKVGANSFVVYRGPVCACGCHQDVEGSVEA